MSSPPSARRERAELTVRPEGVVEVVIGTQPSGQGHETSFAQVTADLLGVPVDAVRIVLGDTDVVSVGGGSHSGRSMRHAGTVISLAVEDLIARGRRLAARVMDVPEHVVEFTEGVFSARGSNLALDFLELARLLARHPLPADLAGGLHVARENEMHTPVFPNGCAVCEVEVDPETGAVAIRRYVAVDDAGRVINPMIVHGQTHGGITQGVGQALMEQCFVDPDTGQPLCGSFLDYAIPRARDLPDFVTELNEVLSPTNPLGIKAGGEGGTTPAPAVVINAIVHALRDYGVRDIEMPATPYKVWQAIRDAQQAPAGRDGRTRSSST